MFRKHRFCITHSRYLPDKRLYPRLHMDSGSYMGIITKLYLVLAQTTEHSDKAQL